MFFVRCASLPSLQKLEIAPKKFIKLRWAGTTRAIVTARIGRYCQLVSGGTNISYWAELHIEKSFMRLRAVPNVLRPCAVQVLFLQVREAAECVSF